MQIKSFDMENETFIKTYENAIPHVLCDMLIEKFDTNTDQWENRDKRTEDRGNLKFNEVHLFKYMDTWKEEVEALADLFKIYVDDYKNQYSEFMFPPKYGIEPFKMKKYEANGLDEFGWHVDVNTTDSMRRWLAFFCYLKFSISESFNRLQERNYRDVPTDVALVTSRCKTSGQTEVFFRKLFTLCRLEINMFL